MKKSRLTDEQIVSMVQESDFSSVAEWNVPLLPERTIR
jgi:hypothetical protein